jgi:hypothetical protein
MQIDAHSNQGEDAGRGKRKQGENENREQVQVQIVTPVRHTEAILVDEFIPENFPAAFQSASPNLQPLSRTPES